jgi:dUTP pyrophosphatase
MPIVKFKFVDEGLSSAEQQILTPKKQSVGAAGYDLASAQRKDLAIKPNERVLVPTGIAIILPKNFEGQIRSRSGLALKHGVMVLNSPGTIDSDYRGEIKVILLNTSNDIFIIKFGMRVAQLVIAKHYCPTFKPVTKLTASIRGDDGFGSTGLVAGGKHVEN